MQSNNITIGLDMGDKSHKAVVLGDNGKEIERCEVDCSIKGVTSFFKRYSPALVAIETGTHCRWVNAIGVEQGHEVLVGNARRLRMIWASSKKNDWNDAEMLARIARTDKTLLNPIRLRSSEDQKIIQLVKSREALIKSRTAIVNRIRGVVKSLGSKLKKCSTESFGKRYDDLPEELQPVVLPLFETLKNLNTEIKTYNEIIELEVFKIHKEEMEILQSIYGVGLLTAATFISLIGDVQTFGNPRDAGALFGLVPRQNQSGDSNRQLRITKEGDVLMRKLLVVCANFILRSNAKDSDLKRFGERICKKGGKNARKRAKVAVARKLAVLMVSMLKNKTLYEPFRSNKKDRSDPK